MTLQELIEIIKTDLLRFSKQVIKLYEGKVFLKSSEIKYISFKYSTDAYIDLLSDFIDHEKQFLN